MSLRRACPVVALFACLLISGVAGAGTPVLAASSLQEVLDEGGVAEDVRSLYAARNDRLLWFVDGRPVREAREVAIRIALAGMEGLAPADYPVPASINGDSRVAMSSRQVAEADLELTTTLLRYASDLHDGRFRAASTDPKWHIRKPALDAAAWLSAAAAAGDIVGAMDRLAPIHPVYRQLRRALDEYVALEAAGGWPQFPADGPRKLEPGARHAQVARLRARLAVTDGPLPDTLEPDLFDPGLEEAVKRFQRRHGLNEDGVVGRGTREALAVPVDRRVAQLRAALERWRWMPRDLGPAYVLVNVPAYRLWFYEDGVPVLTMRTIVGQYKRQTPTFSASISYFVLRPKWYVPHRIAVQDLVPKAQDDPDYYGRGGYVIYEKETGEAVDPATVDWSAYGPGKAFPYRLVQGAGDSNALGDIKFMFRNPYGVYLHDTSSPRLFSKDARSFSSGCIRVQAPLDLASRILSQDRVITREEVAGMIERSPKNRHLTLGREVPLHVVYLTAWADGEDVYFYHDVYRRDRKLLDQIVN